MKQEEIKLDEIIVKLRRHRQRAEHNRIEDGIYVGDQWVTFKNFEILDGRIQIMLPDDFVEMPPEMARMKYPSENRPEIIMTSLDTNVNFTFKWFEHESFNIGQVEGAISRFKLMLSKIHPEITFLDSGVEEIDKIRLSWLQYISPAIDQKLFNIAYFLPIENCMLFGGFNCAWKNEKDWWFVAFQVMRSIQDISSKRRFRV